MVKFDGAFYNRPVLFDAHSVIRQNPTTKQTKIKLMVKNNFRFPLLFEHVQMPKLPVTQPNKRVLKLLDRQKLTDLMNVPVLGDYRRLEHKMSLQLDSMGIRYFPNIRFFLTFQLKQLPFESAAGTVDFGTFKVAEERTLHFEFRNANMMDVNIVEIKSSRQEVQLEALHWRSKGGPWQASKHGF